MSKKHSLSKMFSFFIVASLLAGLAFLVRPASLALADTALPPVSAGASPQAVAVNPVTNKVYVANYNSNTVTVINGVTHGVTTVNVGSNPYALGINPTTNKVYVANLNSASVTVIDGVTNGTTTVNVGSAPQGVAVNSVTNKIYIANDGSNTVSVIDGATNGVTTIGVGGGPSVLALNPVTNRVYIANYASNTVSVIDGVTNIATIPVGTQPRAVAVNPVTNKIYVANQNSNNVTVINGATNGIITFVYAGGSPWAVAVNPISNRIYIANYSSASVTVIDGATDSVINLVSAGGNPAAVAVNSVTNKVYVANYASNTVTVIDGVTNSASTLSVAGGGPIAVAVNPVTNMIYVANYNSYNVAVIDGATNGTTTVAVVPSSYAVVVNPATNKVYAAYADGDFVAMIDGDTNGILGALIPTGRAPNAMALNPVTNKVYVVNYLGNTVTVIDGVNRDTATVAVGALPYDVAVNPVTNKIYVANCGSNSVTVIDGATNGTTTIAARSCPSAVAVNPVTNKVYVTNNGSYNMTVIDGVTNGTTTVGVGASPYDVVVNPVTNKVYVANAGDNSVYVIDGTTNGIIGFVSTGSSPRTMAVNPVTNKVYVGNYASNNVTVIDGASNGTTTVGAGTYPYDVVVNLATNKVYVTNLYSATVTVIDGVTNITATVAVGTWPYGVDVNPVTNKVYVAGNNVAVIAEPNTPTQPLAVAITPLPGNITSSPTPSFVFTATSTYSPTTTTPQNVFYQVDTWTGQWLKATSVGGSTRTGATPAQQVGTHILYALASDGQDATSINAASSPIPGGITAYVFTVMPLSLSVQVNKLEDTNDGVCDIIDCSLREAIDTVGPNGSVSFAPALTGTITLSSTLGTLNIAKNLTINGPTTNAITVSGNNAVRVISMTTGVNVSLSNLTIADGNAGSSDGGGISNNGTLTLTNCQVSTNSGNRGGGIYSAGNLIVTTSVISNNVSADNGGGIFTDIAGAATIVSSTISNNHILTAGSGGGICSRSPLTITGSTISHNSASPGRDGGGIAANIGDVKISQSTISVNDAPGVGGGIFNDSDINITLVDTTIQGNHAGESGGGIYNKSTSVISVTHSIVSGNEAGNDGGGIFNYGVVTVLNDALDNNRASEKGGGIYNSTGAQATVVNSFIRSNSAYSSSSEGAGIYNDGQLTITGSTFEDNNGTHWGGGAIYNQDAGTVTAANTTFKGNYSSTGGGIANYGVVTLFNDTFDSNGASDRGGAIFNAHAMTLVNTIVANSPSGSNCNGLITDGGNNLQYPGASCGGSIPTTDPLLGTLQDNGGGTLTMMPQLGSPAIDAGNNAVCNAAPVSGYDQRGNGRPIDGDQNGSFVCDIGAVEQGWAATGENDQDNMGGTMNTVGDVNGDGYSDVIFVMGGGWQCGHNGRVYLYYGSAAGLAATPALTLTGKTVQFGQNLHPAGDVNGDGYADVVIADPGVNSHQGEVYLYLGSASGLSATSALTLTGQNTGDGFGAFSGIAGDVNDDGYADVLVSADQYPAGVQRGRVYLYLGNSTGLSATPALTLTGESNGDQFGSRAITVGDINGDGYSDFMVTAVAYPSGNNQGRVYIYLGSGGTLSATPQTTLTGENNIDYFGGGGGAAGDVNGDGYADVAIGALGYPNNDRIGRVYVYLGSAGGLSSSPHRIYTGESRSYFGNSTETAGDINGDGYADLLIGAFYYGSGNPGRVYVYLGSVGGLGSSPSLVLNGQAGDGLGSVAPAGDVNGDGYSDYLVGATAYPANAWRGRAYLYYGHANAPSTTVGWTTTGESGISKFGEVVVSARDINGDGYADAIVGSSGYPNGGQKGRVYGYLGGVNGLSATPAFMLTGENNNDAIGEPFGAGDVNGDGYTDIVVGAPGYPEGAGTGRVYIYQGSSGGLNLTPALTLTGSSAGDMFGGSLDAAGDVNGDGYADVLIGSRGYLTNTGRVYLYLGSAGGLSATPALTLTGENQNNTFGANVRSAGDVNRDGYSDFIVGAGSYPANNYQGRVYLYLGGPGTISATPALTLTGENNGDRFESGLSAGDINGDGYSDVVIGAYLYPAGNAQGRAYVYFGGPGGLSATPAFTLTGQNTYDLFSNVTSVGDVNGDGYADVVIGAAGYSSGVGRVYLYLGGASGLSTTPAVMLTGGPGEFGGGLAFIGDANGDGYSDVMVGARGYNGYQGQAYLYYGNASAGLALRPRQMRTDGTAQVAPLGSSDSPTAFQIRLNARTPYGRGKAKLEWQVAPLGTPFTATTDVINGVSTAWMDIFNGNVVFTQNVTGLMANTQYHWRARLRYQPASTPFQQYSRWVTQPWNGWNEADLRTAAAVPTITGFAPASGPVSTTVTITGTDFTRATAVRFNGTAASFSVVSSTQISATVPVDAATGPISVTTPGGTATSSSNFTVTIVCPSPNNVGGTIATNSTWYRQCSPYIVTANVGVAPGVTLTIQSSVEVRFNGNYNLNAGGTLIADGTESQPIRFMSNTGGTWGRIYFDNTSIDATTDVSGTYQGGNILRWAQIESASLGIACNGATPYLAHVATDSGGIDCTAGNTRLWLADSDVTGNVTIGAGVIEAGDSWTHHAPTARVDLGMATASNGKLYAIGGSTSAGSGDDSATVEEYDPATNTWATRASMPTARRGLGVAAASNGKIYAIGGSNSGGSLATVEEYDPATNTWATRANMPTARSYLGVAPANNGKIYAIGGNNGSGTAVEEYDPATNTWATRANMPTARWPVGVVAASNGKIYAIGGAPDGGSPLATVEEYDPATNTWATRASMPTARWGQGVVAASNGKIYAIGGCSGGGNFHATVEEYDPAVNTWTTRASMPTARDGLGVAAASNGKIYAFGGYSRDSDGGSRDGILTAMEEYTPVTDMWIRYAPTAREGLGVVASNGKLYAIGGYNYNSGYLPIVETYDPSTNTWATRASMPSARWGLGVVAASNGKLYAIGGNRSNTVEEYDPATNTWVPRTGMPTARDGLGVAMASNGKIYAIGGFNGSTILATVEEYDPATDTWATRASMPTARTRLGVAAASNGKIYAIGGNRSNTVEEYDPSTNTWATCASMPTAREYLGVVAASNGKIYAIGGTLDSYGDSALATVEEYDPSTNTWATRASMPTARAGLGVAAASNGKLYVIGGRNDGGYFGVNRLTTVEEYTFPVFAYNVQNTTIRGGNLNTPDVSHVLTSTVEGGGISVGSNSLVQGNNVENSVGWGISAGSNSTLTRNRVVGNAGGINAGDGLAQGNLIANSVGTGLQVSGTMTLISNTLTGNHGNALVIVSGAPVIHGNNLEFNTGTYDLVNNSASAIDAGGNWWGTTNTSVIDGRVYDYLDDHLLGTVTYTPVLTGPAQDAPAYARAVTLTPPSPVGIETVAFDVLFSRAMNPASGSAMKFHTDHTEYPITDNPQWLASDLYRATYGFTDLIPRGAYSVTVSDAWDTDGIQIAPYANYAFTVDYPSVQYVSSVYTVTEGAGAANITVTLSSVSDLTTTVNYTTSDGTATAGSDYTAISGTLTFNPGQITQTFSVSITNDTLYETNETVTLTLSSPSNATLGTPNLATLTILDDDSPILIANFDQSAASVAVGTAVIFTDTSTTNVPPISNWGWDFGDGGISFDQSPTHTYTSIGNFTITLQIADTLGYTAVHTSSITVYNPAVGLSPAVSTRVSAGAIATHTLVLTNTGLAANTFSFTGTNSLAGWTISVPVPLMLNAGVSANVVVTVSILAAATNNITDTAAFTVTAPGLTSAVAALVTGTGCRFDFDTSGRITLTDVSRLTTRFNVAPPNPLYNLFYDFDHSGRITLSDVSRLTTRFNMYCPK